MGESEVRIALGLTWDRPPTLRTGTWQPQACLCCQEQIHL